MISSLQSSYLCVCGEDDGCDESSVGRHCHADVHIVVLAYERLHPAGVGLGDLAQSQSSCLDHKVVGGELELSLMRTVDLLTKSATQHKSHAITYPTMLHFVSYSETPPNGHLRQR